MPNITTMRQRFTGEWATRLPPEAILALCRALGYTAWRGLTPVTTMPLFLWPMLHGHTACSQRPPLSGLRCRAAAYGQARARLPVRFVARLLEPFGRAVQRSAWDEGRWHGQRTCWVDGSGGSRPDTPAVQAACGPPTAPRPGCGFPVARLLGLCPAGSGGLLKRRVAPRRTPDLARGQAVHPRWPPGAVLGADRGLCSSAHLARLVQAGVHAVRRVGARPSVDCTPGRPLVRPRVRRTSAVNGRPRSRWLTALGVHDQLVAWLTPTTCPSGLTPETFAARPDSWGLREGRSHLATPGVRTRQVTLGTTRLEAAVSRVADLAELSRQRWPVETARAQLQTTMPMAVRHGKTVPGVLNDVTVFALVSHLVRLVMCPSATRQHLGVERSSFGDALRWLGAPSTGVPWEALIVTPIRPHRMEPRVKKRRPKSFPFMIKPRQELRQQLVQHELRG